jgi:hypothetical protein
MNVGTRSTAPRIAPAGAGTITLVLGVLFLAATAFTYALSLSDSFNPPTWVRAVGLVWLPIGFLGTPIAYALARNGPGRHLGTAGLAVALLGLLAFVVLQFIAG